MKRYRNAALAALTGLAVLSLAASAHAQSVAGQWEVSYRRKVARTAADMEDARAIVTITQRGDSVFARWQVVAPATPPTQVKMLRGAMHRGLVQLVADPIKVTVRHHIFDSEAMLTPKYQISVNGARLSGTMIAISDDGEVKTPPMTFVGSRTNR